MEIFPEEVDLRQEVAARYDRLLAGAVKTPIIRADNVSAWAQYSVLHPRRDEVIGRLRTAGIPTAIYYPIPLHLQEAFAGLGYRRGDFPIAEKIAGEIFSLPMHPYLRPEDQEMICAPIVARQ
jgi:UDP-2-acetamido-2-deoxy-ribo-hexuluronate aminotransferase